MRAIILFLLFLCACAGGEDSRETGLTNHQTTLATTEAKDGTDSQSGTADMPTSSQGTSTAGEVTTQDMSSTESNSTAQEEIGGETEGCKPLSCEDFYASFERMPQFEPNCDDGLQAREVLDIVIESYQKQFPWLTECFDGDPNDLKAVAFWLNLKYDGLDQAPATDCLLDDMLAYNGRPLLALQPGPDGNYGLGETEKVVTQYCFSGAQTDDNQRHIDKVSVVSLFSELPSNVTVRLQCDGDEYSVVLEDSSDVVDVDCSMPSGVAGSLHLEVDIAEQGGQVGDQFRLEILGALVSDGYQMHVAGANLAPLWTLQ